MVIKFYENLFRSRNIGSVEWPSRGSRGNSRSCHIRYLNATYFRTGNASARVTYNTTKGEVFESSSPVLFSFGRVANEHTANWTNLSISRKFIKTLTNIN